MWNQKCTKSDENTFKDFIWKNVSYLTWSWLTQKWKFVFAAGRDELDTAQDLPLQCDFWAVYVGLVGALYLQYPLFHSIVYFNSFMCFSFVILLECKILIISRYLCGVFFKKIHQLFEICLSHNCKLSLSNSAFGVLWLERQPKLC